MSSTEMKLKSKGGRKKSDPRSLSNHQVKFYVTAAELKMINADFEASGNPSRSDFLKSRILNEKRSTVNPVKILSHLDKIGTEINRIGNNMNQIAKYANSLSLRRDIDVHPIKQFNKLMDEYMSIRRELVKAYRSIARSLK